MALTLPNPYPKMKRLSILFLFIVFAANTINAQSIQNRSIKGLDATGDAVVYFSVETGEIIPAEAAAFGGWDIGFQGTTILVNGEAQYVESKYDALTEAPAEGYLAEESGPVTLPTGDKGWFNYDFNTHVISPVANRILVLKNKKGLFTKLEILDYYKVTFGENGPAPAPRYYTFRYTTQANGTQRFTE